MQAAPGRDITSAATARRGIKNRCWRLVRSVRSQGGQIIRGGWPILQRKSFLALQALIAIPIILVIRIVHPILLIRFKQLSSSRIGHFAANTELYLCEQDLGMHPKHRWDLFSLAGGPCNEFLKMKWQQQINISSLVQPLNLVNLWLPGGVRHIIPLSDRDINGLLPHSRVHLEFTEEEEKSGQTALREMGIPEGASFVCFHTRDSAFLDATHSYRSWHYHDYRDSSIKDYVPAIEELVQLGYFGIRMGAFVKESLNSTNPKIIDYATKYRTDFLDIYLSSKCSFFLGSTAGLVAVPRIFRRPIVMANLVPLGALTLLTFAPGDIFIPKKIWISAEGRFMTYGEIIGTGERRFYETENYEDLGIEAVENTSEEISAVSMEMDQRLKGTWQTTEEEEELHQRFSSLLKPKELCTGIVARIGTEFLRQNPELLE